MKTLYKNRPHRGFSLIETLVYLAIFATFSVLVINSFILVVASFTNTRTNRDLLEGGSNVMERISREIRQAKNIDVTNSTLGSSPGVLQLNSTDSSGTAETIKFSITNGALNIYQNGTLQDTLLGQNISPTSLIFRRISTTKGEAVKVEMTMQDSRSKTLRSENFYDTVILRGEY